MAPTHPVHRHVLGGFATAAQRDAAMARLGAQGFPPASSYGPTEPDAGMGAGMGSGSRLPVVMLLGGMVGALGAFGLQSYATVAAYPLDIGGRPHFFWPAYIPFALEAGFMGAMLSGFASYLVAARLLRLYDPVDENPSFRRAMIDHWFVAVAAPDDAAGARIADLLGAEGASSIEEYAADAQQAGMREERRE
ncbi:quinol:electron acceptor oxidoreductase subunit ActD [Nguyenibacter vanlangensis]|uniref:Quinol:electron acceptor oxidoreductase subunit ActD n=1 Tax=Nguyenibacter vanlangensis TaxID=1216886 RepID=A0ABZ3D901_9PROT